MINYIKTVITIGRKEIASELKTKETVSTMIIFSLITIVIFSFSFKIEQVTKESAIPGMLWIMIVFSSLLGLGHSFKKEHTNKTLPGLLMAPVDRSAIFYGKLIANMVLVLFVEIISIPLFFILFNYSFHGKILIFAGIIFLGTLGFISIGTFLSALTANTRSSELLLPVALFPVSVPLLIAAVKITEIVMTGNGEGLSPWIQLLIVFNAVFLVIPLLIFEYILEA